MEQKIIECAAMVYGVQAGSITMETDIREDLSSQSIKLLAFVSAVEEECGVVIDFSQVGGLKTIGDVVDKVSSLKQPGSCKIN